MSKKFMLSENGKFKGKKLKLIVSCAATLAIVLSSGFTVFATDASKQDQGTNGVLRSLGQFKIEMKLPVAKPVPVENKQSNNNTTDVQKSTNNESTKNQSAEQNKVKSNEVNTNKKENTQVKKAANTPITYTSKSLGISFDIPSSWANKYVIRDNGTEVKVFMKHDPNLQTGDGLLFIITSDINDYNKGGLLDTIGDIKKLTEIKDKKYLVGGPKDCRIEKSDPDKDTYTTMVQQAPQVLKSLR